MPGPVGRLQLLSGPAGHVLVGPVPGGSDLADASRGVTTQRPLGAAHLIASERVAIDRRGCDLRGIEKAQEVDDGPMPEGRERLEAGLQDGREKVGPAPIGLMQLKAAENI